MLDIMRDAGGCCNNLLGSNNWATGRTCGNQMDENQWSNCNDPRRMLEHLEGIGSERKLRLFGVACCRRIWNLLVDQRSQKCVEFAEGQAEQDSGFQERRMIVANAQAAAHELQATNRVLETAWPPTNRTEDVARSQALRLAASAAVRVAALRVDKVWIMRSVANDTLTAACMGNHPPTGTFRPTPLHYIGRSIWTQECRYQCQLIREVFGNPFHRVAANQSWANVNAETAISVARAIHSEKAYDRMPILGDALEDAGCTSAEMLDHCRQPGEHVRGCWLIDLLLGNK